MDPTENTTPTTDLQKEKRLRPSGGYRRLRSFQLSTVIYDATVSFCNRFVDRRSRTHDQMVQAAGAGGRTLPKAAARARQAAKRKRI